MTPAEQAAREIVRDWQNDEALTYGEPPRFTLMAQGRLWHRIAHAIEQARQEEREWTAMAGAEVFSKEIDGLGAFELIEMADKIEAHASARAQESDCG